MSQNLVKDGFRTAFKVVDKDSLRWFPGHMNKGMKQMQQKLKHVDCIVEVHDARIPMSGRNLDFKYTISGIKPHVLVLNKVDLIHKKYVPKIEKLVKTDCPNVIFTNCKDHQCKGVKNLFPLIQNVINNSDRYNRANEDDCCLMIIGIPNVGKSSLINSLRNRYLKRANASAVGSVAGITRSVLNKIKMSEDPLFYMYDTPGILTPKIDDNETGLKLALCATLQDHLVGEVTIADYLLYWLNKHNKYTYVDLFELKEPCDNIVEVLAHIALRENKIFKIKNYDATYVMKPDLNYAAKLFTKSFRTGELGHIVLDRDFL